MTLLAFLLSVALLAAMLGAALKHVPEGHVYSLYRGGQAHRLLQPGFHFIVPGLDRVAHRIDLNGRVLHFDELDAGPEPLQGTVYWQVLEPERADPVMGEAEQLIRRSLLDALEAEPTPGAGGRVLGGRVKQRVNHALRQRGMMVTRVELDAA